MAKTQKQKGGSKKHGRNKSKNLRKGSPISLFVRDRISGEKYFTLTNQKIKTRQ